MIFLAILELASRDGISEHVLLRMVQATLLGALTELPCSLLGRGVVQSLDILDSGLGGGSLI